MADQDIEETKEPEIPSIGDQVAYRDVKTYISARGPDSQRLMTYSDKKWIEVQEPDEDQTLSQICN